MSPRDETYRSRRHLFLAAALAVGVALLVLLVVLADARALLRLVSGIGTVGLAVPIALGLLSYVAMARSYQGIAVAAAVDLPFGTWLRITFVSNTVNYLVTSAGLSGFAVRMLLLAQHGVPSGRAVVVSLVQTLLTNFTILALALLGLATLLLHNGLVGIGLGLASAFLVGLTVALVWTVVIVFRRRLRRRTLIGLTTRIHRIVFRIAPRWAPPRRRLLRFERNLDEGLEFVLERKDRMLGPAAWILLDWFITMGILWWAFRVLDYPIAPGLVMMGFGVGAVLSLVSVVPGGLGIVEGSMTAVFVALGVPFDTAVAAVLVFRLAYYVVPVLVSLFFFHGVVRHVTSASGVP